MQILEETHHSNFISEFKTDVNFNYILEHFHYINDNAWINRNQGQEGVRDSVIFLHDGYHDTLSKRIFTEYCQLTGHALNLYIKKYTILANRPLEHTKCKLQRTRPGEGYHTWHFEDGPDYPYRKLITMLYINDDYEAGETEFIYQQTRINPVAGKFLIFPASWTHTHRGNQPLNGDKYILTSWVEQFPSQGA